MSAVISREDPFADHAWPEGDDATPRVHAGELLTGGRHSRDFTATRADSIRSRLALVQLIFALGFLAWSPLDYLLLYGQTEAIMLFAARVGLAVLLGGLWLVTRRASEFSTSITLLLATMLVVALFYAASMTILQDRLASDLIGGYRALPFMLVVLTALFPVTVVFGAGLVLAIMGLNVGVEAYLGQLTTITTINNLWMLALVGGIVVWVQAGQLALQLRLYGESARDPVTGLVTRRVFRRALARELGHCRNQGTDMSLVALEIRDFERLRDLHGQRTSDGVLQQAAAALSRLPGNEEVGRYDSDVMTAALPGVDLLEAVTIAEKLRGTVERTEVTTPDGERIRPRVLVAVSQFGPRDTLDEVMERIGRARASAGEAEQKRVIRC